MSNHRHLAFASPDQHASDRRVRFTSWCQRPATCQAARHVTHAAMIPSGAGTTGDEEELAALGGGCCASRGRLDGCLPRRGSAEASWPARSGRARRVPNIGAWVLSHKGKRAQTRSPRRWAPQALCRAPCHLSLGLPRPRIRYACHFAPAAPPNELHPFAPRSPGRSPLPAPQSGERLRRRNVDPAQPEPVKLTSPLCATFVSAFASYLRSLPPSNSACHHGG